MTPYDLGGARTVRPDGPDRPALQRYGVYGVELVTDVRFTFPLSRVVAPGAPRLRFEVIDEPPDDPAWCERVVAYDDGTRTDEGELAGGVMLTDGGAILRFSGVADFFVEPERVRCLLSNPAYAFAVEIWLLGTVLAYWLELRGVPVLHASAIVHDGRAAAFLATNKGGKSSLAAAFLQRGDQLLSDDLLPLRPTENGVLGHPGYPQMRLWPEQARRLLDSDAGLRRVQPGSTKLRVPIGPDGLGRFHPEPAPLRAVYLAERFEPGDRDARVEVLPVVPGEALATLLGLAFLGGIVDAVGLTATRFATLADTVRQVRVRRLRYPSGVERLDEACDAVERDLTGLAG